MNTKNFYVYVLRSLKDGRYYIGQTSDLDQRLKRHNTNTGRYTKNKGPFVLIYKEEFISRSEAMRREKFLKSGQGREYLKEVIPR